MCGTADLGCVHRIVELTGWRHDTMGTDFMAVIGGGKLLVSIRRLRWARTNSPCEARIRVFGDLPT